MKYTARYASPLGGMTLASDGQVLTGTWFDGQKYFGAGLSPDADERSLPIFTQAFRWLDIYFSGREPDFMPDLGYGAAGPFRRAVWDILRTIPYGTSVTYGAIAAKLARPAMSAQAVGGAVGHNPLTVFVPCHRVIGANGSLTGYAGGIERKGALLALERGALKSDWN